MPSELPATTRTYLLEIQSDLRNALADLRAAQRSFAELRALHAPNNTVTEMVRFLALAETRQAISDKDYALQRLTGLGAAGAFEIEMLKLLHL